MRHLVPRPIRSSLTQLVESSRFKRHFKLWLPHTREYVTLHNRKAGLRLLVPPSEWTSNNRHWIVGTATEYAVALESGVDDLAGVCSMATTVALKSGAKSIWLISLSLSDLLEGNRDARWPKLGRLLCALAEIDGARKSGQYELDWLRGSDVVNETDLDRALERRYPLAVVEEIRHCANNTLEDLPAASNRVHGPVFVHDFGPLQISGEGDFLLDRCLVDLKLCRNARLRSDLVYQALGYALLDSAKSRQRVDEVAIYNARCRSWWREDLDSLAHRLGRKPFKVLAASLIAGLTAEAKRTQD